MATPKLSPEEMAAKMAELQAASNREVAKDKAADVKEYGSKVANALFGNGNDSDVPDTIAVTKRWW